MRMLLENLQRRHQRRMLQELHTANMRRSQLGREWLEGSVHGLGVVLEDQEVDASEDPAQLAMTLSGAGALAPQQKRVRIGRGIWGLGDRAPPLRSRLWRPWRLAALDKIGCATLLPLDPNRRLPSLPPLAQVLSNLLRVKQVVQQRIKRLGAARTGEFLSAAAHGDTQRIKTMLEQHLSPNVADYDGGWIASARAPSAL
jgi:hypothetical protein